MKYLYIFATILFTVYGQMILKWQIMSLAPAIVFLLGVFILNKTFTVGKVLGLVLIILGIIITVKF